MRVHRIINILDNFATPESDQSKKSLQSIFAINEKNTGEINPNLPLKKKVESPKIFLKKYDFPIESEGDWEDPIRPAENPHLFMMAYWISLSIDFVKYQIFSFGRLQNLPQKKSKSRQVMFYDNKWVEYRNELLIGRRIPHTNLRILANKIIFYITLLIVYIVYYYLC